MSTNRVAEAIRVVVTQNRHAVKPDTIFDIEGDVTEVHKPYEQKVEYQARLEFGLNYLVEDDVARQAQHRIDVPKYITEMFVHEFYGDIKQDAMEAMREVYRMSPPTTDNIFLINALKRIIEKCSV